MQAQIYLKGIEELERQANKLIKEVNEGKTKLLLEQAKLVRDRIKEKAPLGPTGNLKKATYAIAYPETTSSSAVAYAGIRPKKAPHAHLIEFGHSAIYPDEKEAMYIPEYGIFVKKIKAYAPHPFVRPAWDETKATVKRNIELGLGKTIEGAL